MIGRNDRRRGAAVRRLAQLGVLSLVVAALGGPMGTSAALEQAEGLTVGEDETVAQEYPPLATFNPAPDDPATGSKVEPEDCRTATWCDIIPLEVVTPADLGEEEEFFVRVKLEWETENIPASPATDNETRAANDLDLYVWDDPEGEAEVASASTNQEPEELALFRPTAGRYQIVVANFLGPNTGYRLTATYKNEPLIPPFESLEPVFELPPPPSEAPAFEPMPEVPEPEPVEAPPASSGVPVPESPVAAPDLPAPPPLEPVAVDADPDFEEFDDSDFADELAAPPQNDVLRERKTRVVAPPEPVSAPMVVLWMAVLPLVLAGGGGLFLARRGSGVLRIK